MTIYFQQRTLAKSVNCTGVGLHSGKPANLTLHPAPLNHGIKFKRVDLQNQPCVPAHFSRVVDTSLATVIGSEGCIVSTIEHLMASFAGLSIDNVLVEVDTYELPFMDGSSGPFTELIHSAGIVELNGPRHYFLIKSPIELSQDDKSVVIMPAPEFKISFTIEYDHPLIGTQSCSYDINEQIFTEEICRARTFGFLHEYEYMKRYGLARGASLENVVVVDKDGVVNEGGLRYPDEFVRHKVLDCVGDISLLGLPLLGHVIANKSGHALNHAILEQFLSKKKYWETRAAHELYHTPLDSSKQVAV
ncbi:MAG: UDP-3-O-acyl-N-acetylglucosamine deacetylase [Desulfobacteraceae bacterium]|nr:UDP-3-O-acyl-N-acetylglucosamine deacetylase [Desulfobacteraceae bacterium]